jgi:hypothetical protein
MAKRVTLPNGVTVTLPDEYVDQPTGYYTTVNGKRVPITQAYPYAPPTTPVPAMPEDYRAGYESPYEYVLRTRGQEAADKYLTEVQKYYTDVAQGPGDPFPGLPKDPRISTPNLLYPDTITTALQGPPQPVAPTPTPTAPRPAAQGPQGPQETVWWTYPQGGGTRIIKSIVGDSGYSNYLMDQARKS